MLADPRSEALVSNFAAQWLHLRNLDEVKAEPSVYPEFDHELVEAFRQETLLFIASTIEEDRSVLDLLGADYTYLNERLARHYGVGGIYGSRFRRVTLPDLEQRGGLLGHGSLLSLTSYPDRTSPVLRGRWLLESIFGAPPPGPPPNVPPLPERGENNAPASVRERLEVHRRNPVCASCHRRIDPPGFMLEHYDAIGRWRSVTEEGRPVDALGTLPNGVTAEGLAGLRGLLLDEPEQFVSTLTERLLAYALGRQPEYFDQPTVRSIVRNAAADQHRWSSVILGIVDSPGVPDAPDGGVTDPSRHEDTDMKDTNFITTRPLSRRTVLRGVGATVALPFLDAMAPGVSALTRPAAAPIRRFQAIFVPKRDGDGVLVADHGGARLRAHADPAAPGAVPGSDARVLGARRVVDLRPCGGRQARS